MVPTLPNRHEASLNQRTILRRLPATHPPRIAPQAEINPTAMRQTGIVAAVDPGAVETVLALQARAPMVMLMVKVRVQVGPPQAPHERTGNHRHLLRRHHLGPHQVLSLHPDPRSVIPAPARLRQRPESWTTPAPALTKPAHRARVRRIHVDGAGAVVAVRVVRADWVRTRRTRAGDRMVMEGLVNNVRVHRTSAEGGTRTSARSRRSSAEVVLNSTRRHSNVERVASATVGRWADT